MKIADLSREEKINLIKRLAAGEVHAVNGEVVELSPIIIYKGNGREVAEKYWIDGKEFTPEELNDFIKLYPKDQTLIFLPSKNEIIEE
jgi:bisphosphoglycerate-independent phosphoglycerate mutase (AlkP superfamily)